MLGQMATADREVLQLPILLSCLDFCPVLAGSLGLYCTGPIGGC